MAKMKDLNLSIPRDNVMYSNISKSKDGYNSARLVAKMGEKEYMSVSYEWEGEGVPAFAMDLMGFMKANEIKNNEVVAAYADDYEEYSKSKTKKEWSCPECGKNKEECKCGGPDKEKSQKNSTKKVPGDTTKKHMPKVCPNCGLGEDDCTCDGKKQLKKTKEKKGKDKKA